MVKLIRDRLRTPLPLEKKKGRHWADLRHKRDKSKRALDRLVEDAVAAAKVNTQRTGKAGGAGACASAASHTASFSLSSDGGGSDPCMASEVLGGSEDEAQRDCEAGLGMDVEADRSARKSFRSTSPSAPPKPNPPSPSEIEAMGPAALAELIRSAQEKADHMRQNMGEEAWLRATSLPPPRAESG